MRDQNDVVKNLPQGHAVVSFVDKSGKEHLNITSNLSSLDLLEETLQQMHGNGNVDFAGGGAKKK
ncbi:MAG: hypothetical protein PHW24_01215 [Candidatus Moranbacteria bacterium]|nr:hypothetical protein [Candidatus Moranbacteria bacterium]